MLALFSCDPKQIPRLRAALDWDGPVMVTTDWDRLARVIPLAQCSVVLVPQLHSYEGLRKLSELRARNPHHPIVLVTHWDQENARRLKDISVDEVIWCREVEQSLRKTIEQVCAHSPNHARRLSLTFQEAENLPRALRDALAYACRSERPVRSIKQIAIGVGSNRATLWHQWRRVIGFSSSLRLEDVLHWILLLRAMERKTPDRPWSAVARDMGVHAHTLGRYARQLTGSPLPQLSTNQQSLVEFFHQRVLVFLLDAGRLDNL